jgi:hypothetical protein
MFPEAFRMLRTGANYHNGSTVHRRLRGEWTGRFGIAPWGNGRRQVETAAR